jgi:DNA-binding transcriptional regulator YdaS (Cro superfamily)
MRLDEYLFRKKLKHSQFARELGCHPVHIGEVIRGRNKAGKHLAKLIEIYTKGEVTVQDMKDIYVGKRPKIPVEKPEEPINSEESKGIC